MGSAFFRDAAVRHFSLIAPDLYTTHRQSKPETLATISRVGQISVIKFLTSAACLAHLVLYDLAKSVSNLHFLEIGQILSQ